MGSEGSGHAGSSSAPRVPDKGLDDLLRELEVLTLGPIDDGHPDASALVHRRTEPDVVGGGSPEDRGGVYVDGGEGVRGGRVGDGRAGRARVRL